MTDTSAEAERVLIDVYRRMTPAEKWRQLGALYRCGRILVEAGTRRLNPAASSDEVRREWSTRIAVPTDVVATQEPQHGAAC